jgi:hypothetical protein
MTITNGNTGAPTALSTPRLRKAPSRPLSAEELRSLTCIAEVLIPATDEYPSGSGVTNFEAAVSKAVGIMGKYFTRLEATLAGHAALPSSADTADWLRTLHSQEATDDSFWIISTIVSVVYVNDEQVRGKINHPVPHRNPPGLTDAADDLEDGILNPVMERGEIFVATPPQ